MTTALSFNRAVFGNANNLSSGQTAAESTSDKPKADIWLNVGLTKPIPNADGTTGETFISLPFGTPLDTMSPHVLRGSPETQKLLRAKNRFLEQLQEMAKNLAPGESVVITGLEIQLRRVKGETTAADVDALGENAYDIDLSSLMSAQPAPATAE